MNIRAFPESEATELTTFSGLVYLEVVASFL